VCSRAVYTVLGVDLDGYMDVLGMYVEESEDARHRLRSIYLSIEILFADRINTRSTTTNML
jgi:hypothetical protein